MGAVLDNVSVVEVVATTPTVARTPPQRSPAAATNPQYTALLSQAVYQHSLGWWASRYLAQSVRNVSVVSRDSSGTVVHGEFQYEFNAELFWVEGRLIQGRVVQLRYWDALNWVDVDIDQAQREPTHDERKRAEQDLANDKAREACRAGNARDASARLLGGMQTCW